MNEPDIITAYNFGVAVYTTVGVAERIFLSPGSFGTTVADLIVGYEPGVDELIIPLSDYNAFRQLGVTSLSFSVANDKKSLKLLKTGRCKTSLVYNQGTGELFYDENGKERGFGNGGQFVTFQGSPVLVAGDLQLA